MGQASDCKGVGDITRQLVREKYNDVHRHLVGNHMRRQLKAAVAEAKGISVDLP